MQNRVGINLYTSGGNREQQIGNSSALLNKELDSRLRGNDIMWRRVQGRILINRALSLI
jgi:hypothetical protein